MRGNEKAVRTRNDSFLIASHLIPKCMGDLGMKAIISRFVVTPGDILEEKIYKFDMLV
jgi:hypothetical protein